MQVYQVKFLRRALIGLIVILVAAVSINYLETWRHRSRSAKPASDLLSADVARSADHIEYSEHQNGVVKFRLRAERLVETRESRTLLQGIEAVDFNPDGSTRNHISSRNAEYDRPGKKVFFSGDVRIDFGQSTRLRTDSLHYDLNADSGYTDDTVQLESPQSVGTARGIRYDNAAGILQLQRAVDFQFHRALIEQNGSVREETFRATSEQGYYSESEALVRFRGSARLTSAQGTLSGNEIEGRFTTGGKHLKSLVSIGDAAYATQEGENFRTLSGERIDFGINIDSGLLQDIQVEEGAGFLLKSQDAEQRLRASSIRIELDPATQLPAHIRSETGVEFQLLRGADRTVVSGEELTAAFVPQSSLLDRMHVGKAARMEFGGGAGKTADELRADDIEMSFGSRDGRNELRSLQARGAVRWESPSNGGAADEAASARLLTASFLEMRYSEDSASLGSGTASGNVAVSLISPADESATRRLEADEMQFSFYPEENRIRELTGNGNVRVVYRDAAADGKDNAVDEFQTSSSQIRAIFLPQDGTIDSISQTGGFAYQDAARKATAGRCDYSGADEILTLRDSPAISEEGAVTRGDIIEYDRRNKTLTVRENVRSVLESGGLSAGPSPSSGSAAASPAVITSNLMLYSTEASQIRYQGHVQLLSEKSQLQAHELILTDAGEEIEAHGSVRHLIITTENRDPDGSERAKSPGRVNSASAGPATITSDNLQYNRKAGAIHYEGRVHLESDEASLWADRMDVTLAPDGQKIERASAQGSLRIRQGEREAKGSTVEYFPDPGKFVVVGNPAEIRDSSRGMSYAHRLTFFTADDRILLENR